MEYSLCPENFPTAKPEETPKQVADNNVFHDWSKQEIIKYIKKF